MEQRESKLEKFDIFLLSSIPCHAIPGMGGDRVVEQASVHIRISGSHESILALEGVEFGDRTVSSSSNYRSLRTLSGLVCFHTLREDADQVNPVLVSWPRAGVAPTLLLRVAT